MHKVIILSTQNKNPNFRGSPQDNLHQEPTVGQLAMFNDHVDLWIIARATISH